MSINRITNDVYSVGVLNPSLRIFDVVMATEFGTTYNSYIVKGSEKTALIDSSHLDFFEAYIENLKDVCEISSIEYLIMNHNEPDHSGSIVKLLELLPNLKIITTQAGSIYLKNIVNNKDMNITVAKDGDTLDLGGKTLTFINAPFLHWPDSMFTYLKEEKILFSCDFFGSHYCEPRIFDTLMLPKRKIQYDSALLNYFTAIFSPFKPYVAKGLEKIKDLEIDYACTSHGPILSKQGFLPEVMDKYAKWCAPATKDKKVIPLFYCSAYNNTELIAQSIAEGISEIMPTAEVNCYDLNEHNMSDMAALLNSCDAFMIGSPTINKDAVPPIWVLLSHIDAINIAKRPVAIFGSYGWSGEAFKNIRLRF
ncbi:MAG: FprA family A-type flavoprotein, partial [Oscillospiraceae bacterium]